MSLNSKSPYSNSLPSNSLSSNSQSDAASASPLCSAPAPAPALARPARSVGSARSTRSRGDHGQTTAEYALVLLGAATIAMLVVTWASSSGAVGSLFNAVVAQVIGAVK